MYTNRYIPGLFKSYKLTVMFAGIVIGSPALAETIPPFSELITFIPAQNAVLQLRKVCQRI